MEYTKGEWEQYGNSILVFQRGCICTAPKPQDGGVMERMENLALITAAPELYEALKAILLNREVGEYQSQKRGLPRMIEVNDMGRLAIAKVEGKA